MDVDVIFQQKYYDATIDLIQTQVIISQCYKMEQHFDLI